jgi:hypothetical protein
VNHQERFVEHHVRDEKDVWTLRDVRDGGVVELASIGCTLPLEEIYLKVALAAEREG